MFSPSSTAYQCPTNVLFLDPSASPQHQMLGEHRTLHVVSYGHFSVAHKKREPVVLEGKMEPTEKAESGVE